MTTSPSVPLENDPRNRCIGCGPEHPAGLRLSFRREGDAVFADLVASERLQGWPDRLHSGFLYLAMLETANWTLYGIRGHVGVPVRTSALDAKRWVATGETLTLRGRLLASEAHAATTRIEASDALGRLVAALEREYDIPDRAGFLRRMGYRTAPPELEDALPE